MRVAAELWAECGAAAVPPPELFPDADCLLAAQARTFLDLNRIHRWEKFTRKEKRAGISVQIRDNEHWASKPLRPCHRCFHRREPYDSSPLTREPGVLVIVEIGIVPKHLFSGFLSFA